MLKYPHLSPENLVPDIKRWLESGGSPHITSPEFGWSLLHHAAAYQDVAAIEYLVALGCDLNVRDLTGGTPLHTAVIFEVDTSIQLDQALDFEVTKRLIELGADLTIQDLQGDTVTELDRYPRRRNKRQICRGFISSRGFISNCLKGRTPDFRLQTTDSRHRTSWLKHLT